MRQRVTFTAFAACLVLGGGLSTAEAQHFDIDFEYESGGIEIEWGDTFRVFEGDFGDFGGGLYSTDDPGFATHNPITPGHVIGYNVLGPLRYHNGTNFAPTTESVTLGDVLSAGVVVNSSTNSGLGYVGQADGGGGFHEHIDFDITTTAPVGAYGVLLSLSSYDGSLNPTGIVDSESFYVVFNRGLGAPAFEAAVSDFAQVVPEPGSLGILAVGMLGCGAFYWRKRRSRVTAGSA